ncbi:MAG: dTDP-4-dehydrorhamnose 3,5-epimerase family protein [Candidatus Woesebacteria bacterium]|jgi:dTDP-4-dehydrorhamnose 3,5-epimerase
MAGRKNKTDFGKISTKQLKAWEKNGKFKVQNIYQKPTINGVILKELNPLLDGRGDVIELWSKPWVDKEGFVTPTHCYQSATDFGVVKCWHAHNIHTDQFTVTRGKLQVSLVDMREGSKTFGHVNLIFMGIEKPRLLKIPPGILHGWKALSRPEVIVVNFQSHVYDPNDEYKYKWNCILEEIWEPKNG